MLSSWLIHGSSLVEESCLAYEWVMSHLSMSTRHERGDILWFFYARQNTADIFSCSMARMSSTPPRLWEHCHTLQHTAPYCNIHQHWYYVCLMARTTSTPPYLCETWLIHVRDKIHSYVRHDSFICETWLIHVWDMTHSYVRHDAFMCETWPIHMWDMTHSYVRHDSFIRVTWLTNASLFPCCYRIQIRKSPPTPRFAVLNQYRADIGEIWPSAAIVPTLTQAETVNGTAASTTPGRGCVCCFKCVGVGVCCMCRRLSSPRPSLYYVCVIWLYVNIYTYTYIYIYVYMCIYVCICMCTYIYIYMYICIYEYIYV